MENRLLQPVLFKHERGTWGRWRKHLSAEGLYYAEFTSDIELLGWPLLHYTHGINPETGTRTTAKGVIAIGRRALGLIAIGHVAFGVIAVGQAACGLLFGLGQASIGWIAVGQLALGGGWGLGQLATGQTAIGQLALGEYVLAQLGIGQYLWTPEQQDPQAVAHFTALWQQVKALFQS